jgi:hypothetical protein
MKPIIARSLDTASLAAIALLVISGSIVAVCCRGLFADGGFHLLVMLSTGDIMRVWPSRLFADYLMDYPVVAALDWGVRSLRALAILFTASLLYVPLFAYSAAIWITRDDRVLWTATLVVVTLCYFPTSFFLVGEFHLLYALFWFGFVVTVSGKADSQPGAFGLALVAFLMIKSYDLSVVLCPILAGLCVWRMTIAANRRVKLLLTLAVGLLLIAAWSGLQGVLAPTDPTSKAEFLTYTTDILGDPQVRRYMTLTALAAAAAFAPEKRLSLVLGGMLAAALALMAGRLYSHHDWLVFRAAYDMRGKAFLLLLAIGVVVLMLRCVGWPRPGVRFAAWPPMLLLLWVAGATVLDTADWARYLEALCTELRTDGEAGTAAFLARPLAGKFNWGWTGPTLSVLLRPEGSSKIIVFHPPDEPSFEPFDPTSGGPDIAIFKSAGPICHDPGAR